MSARLILASSSPRRIELLKSAGYRFQVIKPNVDEAVRKGEAPKHYVKRLSLEKALSVAESMKGKNGRILIIAADTTVVDPRGRILGKPENQTDAKRMLKTLCGNTHVVHTGYSIIALESGKLVKHSRVVSSKVKLRKLSPDQIHSYVQTGEPSDKAGAYAAQGIGMTFVEEIRGSYTNVVGLPMSQLLKDLEERFQLPFLPKKKK